MRKIGMGAAVLAGAMLLSASAFAQTPAFNDKFRQIAPGNDDAVPNLAPGEDLAIACEAIERVADPSDVRVVLTIAAMPGDTSPGYKKILAINEKVTGSAVHLKVPNAPDLANHTIDLAVYVADGTKNNDCDGGKYRIVETKAPAAVASPARNPG
jgi:hypothetical protein